MIKLKSDCKNCKALDKINGECNLKYKIESIKGNGVTEGIITGYKPLEPCPKPKTIKEFVSISITK